MSKLDVMKTPRARRRAMIVAGACVAMLAFSGCAASSPTKPGELTKITVSVPVGVLSLGPFYVAEANGYFKEHGLDVQTTVIPTDAGALAALLSGATDFAMVAVPSLLSAFDQGASFKVVALMGDQSQAGCAVRSDIADEFPKADAGWEKQAAAIAGHTLAVPSIGGGIYNAITFSMSQAGVSADQIKNLNVVAMGSADPRAFLAALQQKTVDVICGGIPVPQVAIQQGAAVDYLSPVRGDVEALNGITDEAWAVTPAGLASDPGKSQAVFEAISEALDFIHAKPDEAAKVIKAQALPDLDQKTFDLAFAVFLDAWATSPVITEDQWKKNGALAEFITGKPFTVKLDDVGATELWAKESKK